MKNWALSWSKGMTCSESVGLALPMSSKSKQIQTYLPRTCWQTALPPRLSLVTSYLKLINWKTFKTQAFCCLLVSSPFYWGRAAQHWHPMAGPNNPNRSRSPEGQWSAAPELLNSTQTANVSTGDFLLYGLLWGNFSVLAAIWIGRTCCWVYSCPRVYSYDTGNFSPV